VVKNHGIGDAWDNVPQKSIDIVDQIKRVADLTELTPDMITDGVRDMKRPEARSILCYWAIKDGEPEGYEFSQYGDAEEDLFQLFAELVDRLKRELARKHIQPDNLLPYQITDQNTVRGRITWNDETDRETPCLVIDGKALSWHEFGRMLMTYEGFHFKLEIFEGFEQR